MKNDTQSTRVVKKDNNFSKNDAMAMMGPEGEVEFDSPTLAHGARVLDIMNKHRKESLKLCDVVLRIGDEHIQLTELFWLRAASTSTPCSQATLLKAARNSLL